MVIMIIAGLLFSPAVLSGQEGNTRPGRETQLSLWLKIKRQLSAESGRKYFDDYILGSMVPGDVEGVHALKGTLLSAKPPRRPTVLVLALSDKNTPEVTLRLNDALHASVSAGSQIQLEGVPVVFSDRPFMLTFDVSVDKLDILPSPAR